MAQNTSDFEIPGTEAQEPEQVAETETIVETEPESNSETITEGNSESISESGSDSSAPESSPSIESGDTGTVYQEIVVSSEYDEQILVQLQVTNNLLGISLALQIFFLGLFFLVFFIKIIKNNVTNLYT